MPPVRDAQEESAAGFRAMEKRLRSMDSILSKEKSERELPDSAESESPPAAEQTSAGADKGVTPKPEPKAAAKPAPKAEAKPAEDDADEGPEPADLEGFKRALAAARGDKRKARKQWQETERKLALLEGELNVLRRQPQAQPQQQPSKPKEPSKEDLEAEYWSDPVGFTQKYGRPQGPSYEEAHQAAFIKFSVAQTRKAHPDYDEKLAAFKKVADQAPHLWQQANNSPDPGGFVYDQGAHLLEVEQFGGDMNAWREAERAKLRAELEAERSEARETAAPARPIPPKSIAGARGNGVSATHGWSGPRSARDIFGE